MLKKKALLFVLAISMALIVSGMNLTEVAADTSDKIPQAERLKITFVDNTTSSDLQKFVTENDIVMDQFSVQIDSGDQVYTSGYVINRQDDFDALWNDFLKMQTALISEALMLNDNTQVLSDLKAVAENLKKSGSLTIDYIVCESGNVNQLRNKTGSAIIKGIEVLQHSTTDQTQDTDVSILATNWVPTSGTGKAWPSQNVTDATYLEVDYRWDSASELSTLTNDSDSTLEADLVFYNYDDEAIATDWYDGNYTYNTNQPEPYLDTQVFDDPDEPVFCVGCSDGASLEADEDYYWIAYANETGYDSCDAKLNMQRGNRQIDNIYGQAWNVFGEETVTVISFSEWNIGYNPSMDFTY